MGQEEIYKLLKKKKKWMTVKEIAKEVGCSVGATTSALNRLVGYETSLKKKERSSLEGGNLWKIK